MNRVVIALAAGVLTGGSALASDRDDILAVLKSGVPAQPGLWLFAPTTRPSSMMFCPSSGTVQALAPDGRRNNDTYLQQGISEEIFTVDNPQQLMISGARIHGGSDHIQGKRFNKTRVSCRPSARHEWRRR